MEWTLYTLWGTIMYFETDNFRRYIYIILGMALLTFKLHFFAFASLLHKIFDLRKEVVIIVIFVGRCDDSDRHGKREKKVNHLGLHDANIKNEKE